MKTNPYLLPQVPSEVTQVAVAVDPMLGSHGHLTIPMTSGTSRERNASSWRRRAERAERNLYQMRTLPKVNHISLPCLAVLSMSVSIPLSQDQVLRFPRLSLSIPGAKSRTPTIATHASPFTILVTAQSPMNTLRLLKPRIWRFLSRAFRYSKPFPQQPPFPHSLRVAVAADSALRRVDGGSAMFPRRSNFHC
jgi:hypothetical protein